MPSVDERVVEMRFDNQQFERGVQTSLNSIGALKKSLNFDSASDGLSNLEKTSNKFSLDGIASAVESVASKFSVMGIVGITALQDIARAAVTAGNQLISAFTIDPVKTGFAEYETQINAIQTILANTQSKGSTLTDVSAALDTLNTYADKTIYNFTEMTRNIGTFTAAGVDLETSVKSIQGIANLAAISGSTSQQASTAMYQLSQALASGTVKLQDWNSVVNAGMGGQVFQDALKETARVHGVAIDAMIKKEGSFRETLSEGWLTSEILNETLEKFTMTTEGLTDAQIEQNRQMLKAKGYTDDQIDAIFELGTTATDAATKVKTFTQLFETLKEAAQSGWTKSWEIIVGDFEEAKALLTEVSTIFGGAIEKSAQLRNDMLQGWKDLGGRTILIEGIRNAFEGLMAVITPIKEAFEDMFPAMTAERLLEITKGFENLTNKFKMWATGTKEVLKPLMSLSSTAVEMVEVIDENNHVFENLKSIATGVFSVFKLGGKAVSAVASGFVTLVSNLKPAASSILSFAAGIGDYVTGLNASVTASNLFGKVVEGVNKVLKPFADGINTVVCGAIDNLPDLIAKASTAFYDFTKTIGRVFGNIKDVVLNSFDKINFSKIASVFNTGVFSSILLGIRDFVENLGDIVDEISDVNLAGSFNNIVEGITGSLKALQNSLNAEALIKIAGAITILAASVTVLSLIKTDKLAASVAAIGLLMAELMASMTIFERIMSGSGFAKTGKATATLLGLSTAVLLLSSAVKKLADLKWDQLLTGLVGVGALLAELSLFLSKDYGGMGLKQSVGLIALAGAVNILAVAVGTFSNMNTAGMLQGLSGVGFVLIELAAFAQATQGVSNITSTAVGMTILGGAMLIFGEAVESMGSLPLSTIGAGLLAMAGSLTAVTVAMRLMPSNMVSTGVGMVGIAAGLILLSTALAEMGAIPLDQIFNSLTALAGSMTVLTVAMNYMQNALPGAAAMLVLSAALNMFVPALQSLGSTPVSEIITGLLALVGAFTVIGAAGYILTPVTPAIVALAGALTLVGVSVLAFSAGVAVFSAALTAMSVAGTAGAAAIVASLNIIVVGIVELVPAVCTTIGEGIVAFASALAGGAAALSAAAVTVIAAIVYAIVASIPIVVAGVMQLLTSVITAISTYGPQLAEAGIDLMIDFVDGLADGLKSNDQAILSAVGNLLGAIIELFVTALAEIVRLIPGFGDELANGLYALTGVAQDAIPPEEMSQVGSDAMTAVAEGIESTSDDVEKAATEVAECAAEGAGSKEDEFNDAGISSSENFLDGLSSLLSDVNVAGTNLASSGASGAGSEVDQFEAEGVNSGQGFINGILSMVSAAASAGSTLGRAAVEGTSDAIDSNSPAKEFISQGEYSGEGFVIGLKNYISKVKSTAENMGDTAVESMRDVISKVATIALTDIDSSPTIRPVLDMSDVTSGIEQLDKMFDGTRKIATSGIATASTISSQMGASNPDSPPNASTVNSGNTYSFTQNNYSPKSLSRIDIYRQTNNQFSMLKGALEKV